MSAKYRSCGDSKWIKNISGSTHTIGHVVDAGSQVGVVVGIDGGASTLATATYGESVALEGIFEFDAASTITFTSGDKVYGALGGTVAATNVYAPGLYFLGYSVEDVASPSTIKVHLQPYVVDGPKYFADATTTIAVAAADLKSGALTVFTSSTSAIALAFPAAASHLGKVINVIHSAGSSAITITPASGTVAGGATYASLDAAGDRATFLAKGTEWVIIASTIA